MHAFLISDGTRDGSKRLAHTLAEMFDLHIIPPVIVTHRDCEDPALVNKSSFLAYHLRLPTTGEVGCALAHRHAQERMIKLSIDTAAIFEDDAHIEDAQAFSQRICIYGALCSRDTPTLININQDALPRRLQGRSAAAAGVYRALTPPYPATAYVLNIHAARAFTSAQMPIRSQADWPRTATKVEYFADRLSMVTEDHRIDSRIDSAESRQGIPVQQKARMWTGLWYFLHRHEFPTWYDFWRWLPRARLIHHIDDTVTRLTRS